jgi:hypothetical protein
MEVHEAGGGINYTVEHTKKASEEELYTLLADRITRMIKSGKKLQMKNLCEKVSNSKEQFYSVENTQATKRKVEYHFKDKCCR